MNLIEFHLMIHFQKLKFCLYIISLYNFIGTTRQTFTISFELHCLVKLKTNCCSFFHYWSVKPNKINLVGFSLQTTKIYQHFYQFKFNLTCYCYKVKVYQIFNCNLASYQMIELWVNICYEKLFLKLNVSEIVRLVILFK